MKKLFEKIVSPLASDPRAEVDAIRRRIELLAREREHMDAMPLPPAEAEDAFAAFLDANLDRAGLVDLVGNFGSDRGAHAWPSVNAANGHALVFGLLVLIGRDQLVAEYGKIIRDAYDGRQSASVEEKREMLSRLDEEVDRLSRQEEAIIRSAETRGITIPRRPDAPPAVVLAYDEALK